jgi:hypothetical protein
VRRIVGYNPDAPNRLGENPAACGELKPYSVMALCLLVYRLTEHRLSAQLAAPSQTVPIQLKQPTDRPTMRWMLQFFEGIRLVGSTPLTGAALGHCRSGAAARAGHRLIGRVL